jgi:hypothetical protein
MALPWALERIGSVQTGVAGSHQGAGKKLDGMEEAVRQRCASLALSSLVIVTLSLSSFSFAACDRAKQQQALAVIALRARIELDQNHILSWIVGQIGPRTSEDPIQAAIDTLRTNADVFCASTTDNFVSNGGIEKENKLGQLDSVILINGKFVPAIDRPTEPVLSRQEASRVALGHVTATGGTEGAVQGIRATVVFVDSHGKVYLAYPVKQPRTQRDSAQ